MAAMTSEVVTRIPHKLVKVILQEILHGCNDCCDDIGPGAACSKHKLLIDCIICDPKIYIDAATGKLRGTVDEMVAIAIGS